MGVGGRGPGVGDRSLKSRRGVVPFRGSVDWPAVGRLTLGWLAAEILLTVAVMATARNVDPAPYLLTHIQAGGTIAIVVVACLRATRSTGAPTVTVGLVGIGLSGLAAYGYYVEPRWLETPELEVRLQGLPAGFEDLRIAVISDPHVGPHFREDDMARVVTSTNALRPDLVVLAGDYVARDPTDAEVVAAGLADLRAPLGIFAVLGNHDYWGSEVRVSAILARAGARLLRNTGTSLERGGDRVWLAGVEDLRRGRPNLPAALSGARDGETTIVLVHNPMAVHEAQRYGAALVLAGHTHGGQIRLPVIGPPIIPIADRSLSSGLSRVGQTQVYVSRGVGVGTPPARLGARPEVPLLVLRRA